MNILIIGDSLAAQRPEDNLGTEERWPYLFSIENNKSITNFSKGFSTTQRLLEKASLDASKEADQIIIQLGVVDCAPRRFKRWEMQFIYKMPAAFQKRIISFLKKRRTQTLDKCYVNTTEFKNNIETFIKRTKRPLIYIHILPASGSLKLANPQIAGAIQRYNKIISDLSKDHKNLSTISFNEQEVSNFTLEDGYHLNKKGHIEVANRLSIMQSSL